MLGSASLLVLLAVAPGGSDAQAGNIQIESSVSGREYSWRVTNTGDGAIVRLEVPGFNVLGSWLPDGWADESGSGGFVAIASDREHALHRGQALDFRCRAWSAGALLTPVVGQVTFDGGEIVRVDGVWAPIDERWFSLFLPPVAIVVLGVLHARLSRGHSKPVDAQPAGAPLSVVGK